MSEDAGNRHRLCETRINAVILQQLGAAGKQSFFSVPAAGKRLRWPADISLPLRINFAAMLLPGYKAGTEAFRANGGLNGHGFGIRIVLKIDINIYPSPALVPADSGCKFAGKCLYKRGFTRQK
ncbi:MAG TPA: hypothetical protein VF799_08675 [Geobacteraceae bacterium]